MSPRSRRRLASGLAVVLAPGLLASACTGIDVRPTDARSGSATASPGDANADLGRLRVRRTDFCGVLARRDVEAALGGPVTSTAHYGNGEEFEVRPGYRDVSHEYGCVFEARGGTTAKAWVFARPVARTEARMLVRRERHRRGCAFPRSLRFGRPSLTSVCRVPGEAASAPGVRARLEGLFGDSWFACDVSAPRKDGSRVDMRKRAEQWCTAVVTTVAGGP